ncbi:Dabb family protein [Rhodococcus sp. (in: high G+C Gram-positive bacteria)]|uniref:Dabb family protein n=1 Tax=Rhodococcus sp. TaxID=1831 RepID=UPI00257FEDFC|nr:Dabb family protein [Rhodococcus sp. (in: high G+C Gram-positive bacteria)]MBQ7803079.1 Dabb family protein [Rhodococcus sp. (in: high G+C Gram-positive bacteria)]
MYKVTRLIHLERPDGQVAGAVARVRGAAATVPATRVLVSPTLPGARNGGDVLVHLGFPTRSEWCDSRGVIDEAVRGDGTRHVDGVEYLGGGIDRSWTGVRPRADEASVYRSLLLRVDDSAAPSLVEKFERELLRMPPHIDSMMSWQLSRVDSAQGASKWTHVWEQSFTDMDGLLGPYMHHPVHWGYVDRWFDPECADHIVKERVCHSFCAIAS